MERVMKSVSGDACLAPPFCANVDRAIKSGIPGGLSGVFMSGSLPVFSSSSLRRSLPVHTFSRSLAYSWRKRHENTTHERLTSK